MKLIMLDCPFIIICLGVLFGHKLLLSLVSDVFKQQFYGKLANGNKAMSKDTSLTSKSFLYFDSGRVDIHCSKCSKSRSGVKI
jgi:hypothetical protein